MKRLFVYVSTKGIFRQCNYCAVKETCAVTSDLDSDDGDDYFLETFNLDRFCQASEFIVFIPIEQLKAGRF